MDLLLSHGYFLNEDPREQRIMKPYPPLGLLSLSAYLKRAGFDVQVVDSTFLRRTEVVEQFRQERPPVVGLYANLMTRGSVLRLAREAKAAGAIVVVGGPEPANYAEEYLARGADVVVIGEGETALEDLLPALRQRGPHYLEDVAGVFYRDEMGTVKRTGPRALVRELDAFPDPDRDAVDLTRYLAVWRKYHGKGSISLITARGCPYTCQWCSHEVFGHTHRRRSVARVVAEIEAIRERYAPEQLWYADDVFTIHQAWLVDFARALKERGLRLPFECISRADRMNDTVVDVLAEMGCRRVWIGSESGSQRVLDAMRRGVKVEQVRVARQLCSERGIEVGMFLMWGYESEEWEDVQATIEHVRRTRPDEFLTTVSYPIKGTPYYDHLGERAILAESWEHSSDREIQVSGRFSRRFYSFADRRMQSLVALDRAVERGGPVAMARSVYHRGRAELWGLGMRLQRAKVVS